MKDRRIRVFEVLPGSIAEDAGIEQGDIILSINGEKVRDVFDYRFLITNEELSIEILKKDNETWEIEIEKDEYEDLGIEFESSLMDDAKSCVNKCVFCFIDQLPKGMRETLYFKDDDSRLSFLMGNYITLTNMKKFDIDRIIKYKMSPVNVSVHTTNKDLRIFMLNNKNAGSVLEYVKLLVDGGISVNCQIVLCRDINDGTELDNTIKDLTSFYPGVKSISVVPVGITRYRDGLFNLLPYDKNSAAEVLQQVKKWQEQLLENNGSRIVYLGDEFYLMAEQEIPECLEYEDFPQIENGVGMLSMLENEFFQFIDNYKNNSFCQKLRNISIATGSSAYNFIKNLAENIETRYGNIKINVFKIENIFFGENVTVTGLLTGGDIASQLKDKILGEELLLCKSMLKVNEDVFLDDYTVKELEKQLGIKINLVENNGKDFIEKIIGL